MPRVSGHVVSGQGGQFFSKPGRFIIGCYLLILVPSTLFLMTHMASATRLHWIDALFMATSALTVTGLGVVDNAEQFTLMGHMWMLVLMQIGGLGQMTISMLILILFGHRISMREQAIVREELNQPPLADVKSLIKAIVLFACIMEIVGTVILSLAWVPEFGLVKGCWYALFHAVSAFNNAGFSLFSNSLQSYADNYVIGLTLALLFIIGGLGFTVVIDILSYLGPKKNWRLSLHSKLVLRTSVLLLIFGTVSLYFLEFRNPETLKSLGGFFAVFNAFFQSATTRTAGFNSIDLSAMTHASLLIMMVLMFIGAGSSSTGGGIKVSTFATCIIATKAFLRGSRTFCAFNRNIEDSVVLKALAIMVVSGILLFFASLALMISENARFDIVLFEAISAFGTVGLTIGLTENLTNFGKLVLVFVMIVGRLGPLTLAYALVSSRPTNVRYAKENVITG
ncbi:MAG: TrkH family potassium uptake protein [Cellvibrionales bacterium]|nr:TrkH family potassium uptake protein [Cellvibrionales bacterium]